MGHSGGIFGESPPSNHVGWLMGATPPEMNGLYGSSPLYGGSGGSGGKRGGFLGTSPRGAHAGGWKERGSGGGVGWGAGGGAAGVGLAGVQGQENSRRSGGREQQKYVCCGLAEGCYTPREERIIRQQGAVRRQRGQRRQAGRLLGDVTTGGTHRLVGDCVCVCVGGGCWGAGHGRRQQHKEACGRGGGGTCRRAAGWVMHYVTLFWSYRWG